MLSYREVGGCSGSSGHEATFVAATPTRSFDWDLDTRAHCLQMQKERLLRCAACSVWGGLWCHDVTSCEQQISGECEII